MNKPFQNSASYYDLLYQDKDYSSESNFLISYLRKYDVCSGHILDLGCGTGAHASLMADSGYFVHGIDMNEEMIHKAHQRTLNNTRCSFSVGDVRNYDKHVLFDAVVSLFHVFSYQNSNADLLSTIRTAARHSKRGTLLIFDFWYGPAVLTQVPSLRVKRIESDELLVLRIARPHVHTQTNIVDVVYSVDVLNKRDGSRNFFTETHSMRYLFLPELFFFLSSSSFTILESVGWLDSVVLSSTTWSGMVVARYDPD